MDLQDMSFSKPVRTVLVAVATPSTELVIAVAHMLLVFNDWVLQHAQTRKKYVLKPGAKAKRNKNGKHLLLLAYRAHSRMTALS